MLEKWDATYQRDRAQARNTHGGTDQGNMLALLRINMEVRLRFVEGDGQERIRKLASDPSLVVPGHDPALFERYPRVADGIVRIRWRSVPFGLFETATASSSSCWISSTR